MLATKKQNSLTTDSLGLVNMERYSKEQRVFIVEQYFNSDSLAATMFGLLVMLMAKSFDRPSAFLQVELWAVGEVHRVDR